MIDQRPTASKAEQLQRAFDHSFAEAIEIATSQLEDLLAIRIGEDPYALRLTQTAGLFADKRIVPLPSPVAELLGIAGIRGVMVPVYDLRCLLGYSGNGMPRWFVLAAGASVGLAFDRFDSHIRLPREALALEDRANGAVREVARTGQSVLPVINLPSILVAIEKLAPITGLAKETQS